ncbi:N-alpha-acetyltransferase 38, NatC auxiliary subunit isoform X2 [Chelmon rostratus]|uniref:N-alpha-acetyltransferase 38, NatC auxiliary subunit isoform X2 n=1 Tax=Chelmon rostratus TaxID=109905 RepID=UPI001BED261E|nr:N-alpha-acetyltransferase 38, NatC auxiliary subunit isoform X2 [Chelmon rostratus]
MATMIEENGPSTHEQSDGSSSSQARHKLEGLLNKNMRIRMTDGRTLVGLFLCTDRDCNVILGSAQEFLKSTGRAPSPGPGHDPRPPRGVHRGGGRQSGRRTRIWS